MILQAPLFRFTLWGLLSLWVFFGCLELAEQLHIVPEAAEEDQAHQDLDEEALIQLASGLKSDAARLSTHGCASAIVEMAAFAYTSPARTVCQLGRSMRHGPPSIRRHQQLSVYRI
jgi:hypothetical protein